MYDRPYQYPINSRYKEMKPDAKQLFLIFVQNLLVENKVYWLYRAYFTHTNTHFFVCLLWKERETIINLCDIAIARQYFALISCVRFGFVFCPASSNNGETSNRELIGITIGTSCIHINNNTRARS